MTNNNKNKNNNNNNNNNNKNNGLLEAFKALPAALEEFLSHMRDHRWLEAHYPALFYFLKKSYYALRLPAGLVFFILDALPMARIVLRGLRSPKGTGRMAGNRILMLVTSDVENDPRVNKEARSLAKAGYQVDILCYTNGAFPEAGVEEPWPGVRYRRIYATDKYSGSRKFYYRQSFVDAGAALEFDAIHAHDLVCLLTAWSLARLKNTPLVFDAHEMMTENAYWTGKRFAGMSPPSRWYHTAWERFLLRDVSLFISVSDSICDEYARRYKLTQRPLLLPNFPDLTLFSSEAAPSVRELAGIAPSAFVTLYLGGIGPARNIEGIIRAHALLPEEFVFLIRGPEMERHKNEYEQLAADLGIAKRVFFLPAVPMNALLTACRGADCGINAIENLCKSFYWSLPNKLFEYMAAELPVAMYNFPEVRACVEAEGCGVTFDPHDPVSIAKALGRLAADPQEAGAMGKRGRAAVLERYNWEIAEKSLTDAYGRLRAGGARA
ncbi:glycosyltransferase family 4 protein [Desulfovibrio sp. OttesenSCG-928-G11]|nr:glycosyltransferase family 4 protein [Desulfovibrio sp. OttesenSCG-928-G11]